MRRQLHADGRLAGVLLLAVLGPLVGFDGHLGASGDGHDGGQAGLAQTLAVGRDQARTGKAAVAVLVVGCHPPLHRARQVGQVEGAVQANGVGGDVRRGVPGEIETAGDRGELLDAHALRPRRLARNPGAGFVAQGHVDAAQLLVDAAVALVVVAAAQPQPVGDPVAGADAHGRALQGGEARRVLIGGHQPDRVPGQARHVDQRSAVGGDRQGRAQRHAALQVVDLIVLARLQQRALQDDAAVLVAHLDPEPLGAFRQVLAVQEVERAPRAAEFLAALQGAGFGGEGVEGRALLAGGEGRLGVEHQVPAVEPAAVLRQLRARPRGLEVAPHHIGAVALQLDVELPLSGRIGDDRRIVPVDRVVAVRVDPPQQVVGVLRAEAREQVLDRLLVSVGAGGQQVFPEHLALQIEGAAPVHRGGLVVVVGIGGHQRRGAGRAAAGHRQVGDRHIEPIAVGDGQVALEGRRLAVRLGHRHLDLVRPWRQDLAGDEAALRVHRHGHAHGGDRLAGLHMLAADGHRTAARRDIAHAQAGLAVAGQRVASGPLGVGLGIGDVEEAERLHARLVEAALLVIDPQHIAEVLAGVRRRGPDHLAADRHGDDRQRRLAGVLALGEDPDLGLLLPPAIVGVGAPGDPVHPADRGGQGPDVERRRDVQRVVLDLDVRTGERHVDAALAVGLHLPGVRIQRMAVDADRERQRPAHAGLRRFAIVLGDEGRDRPGRRRRRRRRRDGRRLVVGDPDHRAPVGGHALRRVVRGHRLQLAAPAGLERRLRQAEQLGEVGGHRMGAGFRQGLVVRDGLLQVRREALVVGVADNLEAQVRLAAQPLGDLAQLGAGVRGQHRAAGLEGRVVQQGLDRLAWRRRRQGRRRRRGRCHQPGLAPDDGRGRKARELGALALGVQAQHQVADAAVVDALAARLVLGRRRRGRGLLSASRRRQDQGQAAGAAQQARGFSADYKEGVTAFLEKRAPRFGDND